jgi:succinate dehydrogenase / fumarate reductase cytochrome b subunit
MTIGDLVHRSTLGHKMIMALSGVVLLGWTVLHMVGNLLVFWGPATINGYATVLQGHPLLWVMRLTLVTLIGWHVRHAWLTSQAARTARGPAHGRPRKYRATTWSARTMRWGGVALGAFVVYHLLHIYGVGHGDFVRGDVYHNVVYGFRRPAVTVTYLIATVAFAAHIRHGLQSAGRSLGLSSHWQALLTWLSPRVAWVIGVGFAAPCLAAQFGALR